MRAWGLYTDQGAEVDAKGKIASAITHTHNGLAEPEGLTWTHSKHSKPSLNNNNISLLLFIHFVILHTLLTCKSRRNNEAVCHVSCYGKHCAALCYPLLPPTVCNGIHFLHKSLKGLCWITFNWISRVLLIQNKVLHWINTKNVTTYFVWVTLTTCMIVRLLMLVAPLDLFLAILPYSKMSAITCYHNW